VLARGGRVCYPWTYGRFGGRGTTLGGQIARARVAVWGAVVAAVASDWGEPVQVAPPVTDACPNDAITISPDGGTLYFFWSPVVNGSDAQLLAPETGTYRASRVGDDPGLFGEPTYLDLGTGAEGGSSDGEFTLSPDDPDTLYFVSDRGGGPAIYRTRLAGNDLADGPFAEPELVISGYVGEPSLVADGSILYFVQVLVDDEGVYGSDIWCVEWKSP